MLLKRPCSRTFQLTGGKQKFKLIVCLSEFLTESAILHEYDATDIQDKFIPGKCGFVYMASNIGEHVHSVLRYLKLRK